MKIIFSIIVAVGLIVIITLGLKRNNGFFNHGYNLGELNYLTPAAKEPTPVVADTTKKAEAGKEEAKAEEPKKEGEAKPAEGAAK